MAVIKEAALRLQLIDGVSSPAKAVGGVLGRLDSTIGRFMKARNETSARLDRMRGRMLDAAASAWALQRALSAPIRAAMDFESAMADVVKVVDFGSPAGLAAFQKDLLDLSARLPVAVSGLARIAAAAGQAGIAGNELLKFTEGAAKIGVAFDISADKAGDAMAKLRTGLGRTTDQTFELADAINQLSNEQASSASDVLDFTTRVGALAKTFGFTAEQASAFGSAMISAGAAPDVAATSFLNMGRALAKGASATKSQGAAFKALGLDATNVAKAMQRDAVKTTTDVLERISKLPAEQRASVASALFGDEGTRALGPLLTNLKLLAESLGIVSDETSYAGSATREYEARARTSANAVQLFRNRLERLSIGVGKALLPPLTELMDTLAPFVDRLAEIAQRFPKVTAAVVSTAAGLVSLRIAATAAAFAVGTLRLGALQAAILGLQGIRGAAGAAALALAPFRAALAASGRALTLFTAAATIGGVRTALTSVGASVLAMLNPLRLLAAAAGAARAALLFTGVGAAVAGVAAAGTWLWQNWSGIATMFDAAGKSFLAALGPARPVVDGIVSAVGGLASRLAALLGPLDESGAKWKAWGATLGDIAGGGVATLIGAIERIAGAISRVIQMAKTGAEAIANFLGSSSGGASGGKAGNAPGSLGTPSDSYKPEPGYKPLPGISGARARGGPVMAGRSYLVGELGPEAFIPRRSGTIVPNDELRRGAVSPGTVPAGDISVHAPVSVHIHMHGNSSGDMQRAAQQAAATAAAAIGSELDRQLRRRAETAFASPIYGEM